MKGKRSWWERHLTLFSGMQCGDFICIQRHWTPFDFSHRSGFVCTFYVLSNGSEYKVISELLSCTQCRFLRLSLFYREKTHHEKLKSLTGNYGVDNYWWLPRQMNSPWTNTCEAVFGENLRILSKLMCCWNCYPWYRSDSDSWSKLPARTLTQVLP